MERRPTRITTALALVAVAGVAAIISYQHAYDLVRSHGESGATAHMLLAAAGDHPERLCSTLPGDVHEGPG